MEISKMGLSNESPLLDSPVMPWLNHTIKKFSRKRGSDYLFNLDDPTCRMRVGECIGQHQSSKKPLHVVPTEAQRSFSRPTSRATQRLGGQDEGALAGGLFSASVRVPRQTSPAVSTVASAGEVQQQGLEAVSKLEKLVLRCSPQ